MATIGFRSMKVGILDDKEKTTKIYTFDAKEGGTINANITGLGAAMNKTYASNVAFYVSAIGVSDPKVELEIADIPDEALAAITGAEIDEETGISTIGANTVSPYVAILMETRGRENDEKYIAMLKGKFAFPDTTLATSEDSGAELNTDSIEGEFVARGLDEKVYAKGSTKNSKFTKEAFEKFVFTGKDEILP